MMAPCPEPDRTEAEGNSASSPFPDESKKSPRTQDTVTTTTTAGVVARSVSMSFQSKGPSGSAGDDREASLSSVEPPDGGWGWAVVAGTVIVNVVVIGHAKSFGVYFRNLMQEFNATPSRVAMLQALYVAMFSFLSPLSSVLSQWLGPRKVALFGGVLACIGMILSAYTPNLNCLYIFYGVLQGLALTFTFTPGITIIAKYFHRRRGLANGLSIAGNALGGMVIPLVVEWLIITYDLRGCFLVMGGILLHACVGAMFWQPVEWHQKRKVPKTASFHLSRSSHQYDPVRPSDCDRYEILSCDKMEITDSSPTSVEYLVVPCPKPSSSEPDLSSRTSVDVDDLFNSLSANGNHSCLFGIEWKRSSAHSMAIGNGKVAYNSSSPHLGDHFRSADRTSNSTESLPIMHRLAPRILRLRQPSRASSFLYLSSYSFGPTAGAILTKEHFTDNESGVHNTKSTPSTDITCPETKPRKKFLSSLCFQHIKIDRSIFQKSRFYIMTVSLFFHILGYPGTLMFLPYRATNLGLSQARAASLLSVLALADLIGRVCCAWLSDFQLCPRKYWFIGGMLLSGVFAYALPFFRSYVALVAATAGFGFCCGAYIGLIVVLFADAYDPEKVALAYSISTVTGGFMALAGPPIMGYVLETTDSYLVCQCILGSAQVAGAAIWIIEPWAVRYEKKLEGIRQKKMPEEEQLV